MEQRLDVVQKTRKPHPCRGPGCKRRIPRGNQAFALIREEAIDGQLEKDIVYFCSIECYNDFEISIMYGAGAATDCELVFN